MDQNDSTLNSKCDFQKQRTAYGRLSPLQTSTEQGLTDHGAGLEAVSSLYGKEALSRFDCLLIWVANMYTLFRIRIELGEKHRCELWYKVDKISIKLN